jgi:predicted MFS family arabinose efflux permease
MDHDQLSSEEPSGPLAGPLVFLAGARLVLNTGYRFVYPFLPVIARGIGIPLTQAGLLVSIRWMTGLAAPAVVRVLGRGERRLRLILAGLAMFATGAVVTATTGVFVGAVVGFILLGLGKPVFDVAAQAYLSDRTPYRTRARYLGILELTWAGALLFGAPAAGWLIARWGWAAPFWGIALLSVVALAAVRRVIEPDTLSSQGSPSRLVLDRGAIALLIAVALYSGASEVMFVVFGAWLEDDFGLSLLALGAAGVLIAVSELIGEGSTLLWTDRIGKRRSLAIGLTLSAAAYLMLAVANSNLTAGLASIALALAFFEFTIVSTYPLASEIRPLGRTRFLALLWVGMGLGRAVGAVLGPVLYEGLGLTANSLVAAGTNLLALVVLVRWVREARTDA